MRMQAILCIFGCYCLGAEALAALQIPENKESQDLGGLFTGEKKPCDAEIAAQKAKADKLKKAAQTGALEQAAQEQVSQEKAVQGLIQLGVIPAEKAQAEKPSLGMLAPAMGNCNVMPRPAQQAVGHPSERVEHVSKD